MFFRRILEGKCGSLDENNSNCSLKSWMTIKRKNVLFCELYLSYEIAIINDCLPNIKLLPLFLKLRVNYDAAKLNLFVARISTMT